MTVSPRSHPHELPFHRNPWVTAFVFAFVAALAFLGVHEAGTWVHIKTGERIAADGRLPSADPFSYSVDGQRWTTESWLGDVLLAEAHGRFSGKGLAALKAAAAGAAFAALLPMSHGHALMAAAVLCGGAAASWPQLTELPAVFDLPMTALFLLILRSRRRFAWSLAWVAALEALWANLNGATAVLGVWLVAFKVVKSLGRTDHKDLPRFLALLGLTAAGWLCNPLGWHLLPYVTSGAAAPQPAWQMTLGPTLYTAFVLAGAGAAWVCLQTEFFLSLTAAALLGLSLLFPGLRAVAVLAACPAISLALGHFVSRREVNPLRALRWALAPAALLAWHWRFVHVPLAGSWGYGAFDVSGAANFLRAQGVAGRMFNELALGDYLVGEGRPVFVDSRRLLYGDDFSRDALDWSSRWKSLDGVYRFDYAVVRNARSAYPAAVLDEDPDWRLAYADDAALVYLKRSGANAWLMREAARGAVRPNRLWPDGLDQALKNPKHATKVLEELDRWIVQSPDSSQALLWKAYALGRLGMTEKSERFLDLAEGRGRVRSDAELAALLGFVLESRGRKGSAQAAYWRAARFAGRLRNRALEGAVFLRLAGLHREWGHETLAKELEDKAHDIGQARREGKR
ncbi:MAG: hypothetical protein HY927_08660 [Elusimicrobia bacterium]|nr:hypothetical protein [Elusimicrobiota bacterium]